MTLYFHKRHFIILYRYPFGDSQSIDKEPFWKLFFYGSPCSSPIEDAVRESLRRAFLKYGDAIDLFISKEKELERLEIRF